MIPYIELGPWSIFGLQIHAFGILVGLAIILGVHMTNRDADKRGLDPVIISEAQIWALVVGFLVAHWFSVIFYFPERLKENPLELLMVWKGISSFGGFVGGAGGLIFYLKYLKKVDTFDHIDTFGYGFAWAWILGRAGCTTAHDHPGKVTEHWFSVQYPVNEATAAGHDDVVHFVDGMMENTLPYVQRYDLGFYEFLFAISIVVFLFLTNRKATRFPGWNVTMLALLYSPVRFFGDTLRIVDKRYWGLTIAQITAIALFMFGLYMLYNRLQWVKKNPTWLEDREKRMAEGGPAPGTQPEPKAKTEPKAKAEPKTSESRNKRKRKRKK